MRTDPSDRPRRHGFARTSTRGQSMAVPLVVLVRHHIAMGPPPGLRCLRWRPLGADMGATTSARVAAAHRWGPLGAAVGAAASRGWLPPSAWMRAAPSAWMGTACIQGRSHGATGRRRGCRAPPWGALLPCGWPPSGAASLLYPALPFSLLRGEIRMRVRAGLIARCIRDVPMVPLLLLLFFFSRSKIGFKISLCCPAIRRRSSSTLPKDEVVAVPSRLQRRRS